MRIFPFLGMCVWYHFFLRVGNAGVAHPSGSRKNPLSDRPPEAAGWKFTEGFSILAGQKHPVFAKKSALRARRGALSRAAWISVNLCF